MTKLLIKLFVKNSEDVKDPKVRSCYGYLGSAVGICSNVVLFFIKLTIGIAINSIAVMADAFNNLSDVASSVVTLVGFKITNRPPDKGHPFGHGRMEYLSGMVVAMIILMVGVELGKTSFKKIQNPEPIEFNLIMVGVLILSVLVKLWLSSFNRKIGRKIGSTAMEATATDSRNDVVATSVVVLSIIASKFVEVPIDGYMGLAVAIFILFSGFSIMRDTIDPLLGGPADPEMVKVITEKIMGFDGIIGVHDLIIHNYGPGRCMATAHAEMPANYGVLESHEIIDEMEKRISSDLGIFIVLHMDPVCNEDEETVELKKKTEEILNKLDSNLTFHDFRMVKGERRTNVIFDIVITDKYTTKEVKEDIYNKLLEQLKLIDSRYELVLEYDISFS